MNKPVYKLPFILVSKIIQYILLLCKYIGLGFFVTLYVFIDICLSTIYLFFKYLYLGFIYLSYFVFKFIKYLFLGLCTPIYAIYKLVLHLNSDNKKAKIKLEKEKSKIKQAKENNAHIIEENKKRLAEVKKIEKREVEKKKDIKENTVQSIKEIKKDSVKKIANKKVECKVNKKTFNPLKIISSPFKYLFLGFVSLSYFVYSIIKYLFLGLYTIFYAIYKLISYLSSSNKKAKIKLEKEKEKIKQAKENNAHIIEENKKRLAEVKKIEKREVEKKKKDKKNKKEIYINENMVLEKKKLSDYINDFFTSIISIPKKIKDKYNNTSIVRRARDKKDINREVLLLDLDGKDAEKSASKIMYKYVAKDPNGKIVKGYFPAYSKVEVHSFLLSEGNEVYSIETNKWIKLLYGDGSDLNKKKIKTKDLIFFTTQLSTYVKAGIPLVESLRILSRQYKNKNYSRIFRSMIYDLTMGDSFSTAMDKQGEAFPRLLINMVKASEMTGELPEALDDMADYFTETDKTRKQMITALTYPAIVLVIAIAAIIFIMVYVVPQFVGIYQSIDGARIPGITIFIMNTSDFLRNKWWLILIVLTLFIGINYYLYKNVKVFKTLVQWIVMHLPVFGNVVIYNEVTMFTKTFASLLSHNVFITDSMEILNKITNNEIYKLLLSDTISNLAKGEKISLAFKDHWAFPMPAYEMIATGEMTGQLPEMMSKVSSYYQELHRNAVARIKTFIEPLMIIMLAAIVGVIVLSIVIPMFGMYTALNY